MKDLHQNGIVVYIRLPYDELERRLSNLATRGVTLREGQTLLDLYYERIPLYEEQAGLIFDSGNGDIEYTVAGIASLVSARMEAEHGK